MNTASEIIVMLVSMFVIWADQRGKTDKRMKAITLRPVAIVKEAIRLADLNPLRCPLTEAI